MGAAALKDAARRQGGGLKAVLDRGCAHLPIKISGRDEETASCSRTKKHH
jgi:hypothetical protein